MARTATTASPRLGAALAGYREFVVRDPAGAVLPMLPLGVVHLIVQLHGTWHHRDLVPGSGWRERPAVFVGGPFDLAYELAAPPGGRVFAIEFQAGGAAPFIDVPIHELRGLMLDPALLWGGPGRRFVERLGSADSHADRVRLAEGFLAARYRPRDVRPIALALRRIRGAAGRVSVAALAGEVGLGVSQFRKRFSETVGLSPKMCCRLARLRGVTAALRDAPGARLTEIAYRFHYADQSHFIRDLRSLTGHTPGRGPLFDMGVDPDAGDFSYRATLGEGQGRHHAASPNSLETPPRPARRGAGGVGLHAPVPPPRDRDQR